MELKLNKAPPDTPWLNLSVTAVSGVELYKYTSHGVVRQQQKLRLCFSSPVNYRLLSSRNILPDHYAPLIKKHLCPIDQLHAADGVCGPQVGNH